MTVELRAVSGAHAGRMGKGIKRPVKAEKSDFKKKKLKLGRKLTKQANETNVDVRVAKLSLPSLPLDDGSNGDEMPGKAQVSLHVSVSRLCGLLE